MTRKSGKTATPKGHAGSGKASTRKSTASATSRSTARTDAIRPKVPRHRDDEPLQTKRSHVIVLMQRPEGASLGELIEPPHWQPHSVRGITSGIPRKKLGLNVACLSSPQSGESRYRILERASAA